MSVRSTRGRGWPVAQNTTVGTATQQSVRLSDGVDEVDPNPDVPGTRPVPGLWLTGFRSVDPVAARGSFAIKVGPGGFEPRPLRPLRSLVVSLKSAICHPDAADPSLRSSQAVSEVGSGGFEPRGLRVARPLGVKSAGPFAAHELFAAKVGSGGFEPPASSMSRRCHNRPRPRTLAIVRTQQEQLKVSESGGPRPQPICGYRATRQYVHSRQSEGIPV